MSMGEQSKHSLMADLVHWLKDMEERASLFYAEAAAVFGEDRELSAFLSALSREEGDHGKLLDKAANCQVREALPDASFFLDAALRQNLEAPFVRARRLLADQRLTKEDLLALIAEAEFSEWNDLFLYLMGSLRRCGREFEEALAEMDQHRRDVEKLLLSFPRGEELLARAGRMPPVWKRRILIVEDEPAVARLIQALLRAEAEVILAADGAEGLQRLREGYFDVIVSDVEMPHLNGIDMYRQALRLDAGLKNHFVFFTASRKPQHQRFFQKEQVLMLPKPSSLSRLRQVINQVAAGARSPLPH
ncbi:response regulator [Geoalkalibacter sp.]|uniref:response regulator n=1 Tax=Geoalkalibacter sp. TaxID=3041440 RepID=UPI00272E228A|nr:response regulator [Geoalkalibacter sp.]